MSVREGSAIGEGRFIHSENIEVCCVPALASGNMVVNEADQSPCPYRKEGKTAVSKIGLQMVVSVVEKVKQRRMMESAGDEDS